MDIACPFCRAIVRPITNVRKEAEIEMIVGVDQPGKQEKPRKVNGPLRRAALDRVYRPSVNRKRSETRGIRSDRATSSRKMDSAHGVRSRCANPGRVRRLAQLQHINCGKSPRGFIQIQPAAFFEDLPLFNTEARLHEGNDFEPASMKSLRDLVKRPSTSMDVGL